MRRLTAAAGVVARMAFLAVVLGPPVALLVSAISPPGVGTDGLSSVSGSLGRRAELLLRTVGFSMAVAATVGIVGTGAAVFLWQRAGRRWRHLRWLVAALAPVPTYVHALAWMSVPAVFGPWLGQPAGSGGAWLRGWIGAWWIESAAYLPIATAFALLALRLVDPAALEAGRVFRSNAAVVLRVALPLAAPVLAVSFGVIFVFSLGEYGVPSLCSVTVSSLDVFAEYAAGHNPVRALWLSLPQLVVTAAVIVKVLRHIRTAASPPSFGSTGGGPSTRSRWLTVPSAAAMIWLAVAIAVPAVVLLHAVASWARMTSTLIIAWPDIVGTVWTGCAAAAIAVPLSFAVARRLSARSSTSKRAGRAAWWLAAAIPVALPAPLVGIGLVAIWNHDIWPPLYGSSWMPVFAILGRFLPLGVLVAFAHIEREDRTLIDAARVSQPSTWRGWLTVRLPLMLPGAAAVAALLFALTIGELEASLVVVPAGRSLIVHRIYNYLHYGAGEDVAGLCLVLAAGCVAAGALFVATMSLAERARARGAR
jgi:iron(III) transport system permease protein